ncbi:MAG: RNA polymerase sigma factor [Planctomycetota bacterium]
MSERLRAKSERVPATRPEDQELVERVAGGDEVAFEELVRRYMNSGLGLAYALCGDWHVAEDIVQIAFLKAHRTLDQLKERAKFASWFHVIVRHASMDHLRSLKGNVSLEGLREGGFEVVGEEGAVLHVKAEAREEDTILIRTLFELRPDYREIIVMKHIDNLSYKQIADRLGMTVTGVGEKLSRVRQLLKQKLEEKMGPALKEIR